MNMTKETKNKRSVTKASNIAEVVMAHPEVVEVFMDWGLHCVGCAAQAYDTIENGSKVHGFTDADIDELVARLNEVIKHKE
ncbi:TPA: disulfide oxidoreductase [candidate division WWE3 bacterium]|uniref:DUF1858 domain-containing protein n=5 Tax=Katanobacteria TaxID=422282 RepID=A0A0G1NFV8_UNCKA|nr:MAG: hypothetical protein UW36_C0008G0010 [candidate division WWE3 bacterium GW2011_GWA2_44_16]KKT69510.1 MAG: hypothetical protein UW65_C0022G0008 [candidate division WWE3 bacterium GW2011_GWB1_44_4]KKT83069.1 MAG: hypothetical protein UW82_C0048G0003 [candidate division WWE3 bacterium GW2011_GWC2_44_9]HAZ29240.1 disulfide oxidoreductase [candidate division WWE3 bacterium]